MRIPTLSKFAGAEPRGSNIHVNNLAQVPPAKTVPLQSAFCFCSRREKDNLISGAFSAMFVDFPKFPSTNLSASIKGRASQASLNVWVRRTRNYCGKHSEAVKVRSFPVSFISFYLYSRYLRSAVKRVYKTFTTKTFLRLAAQKMQTKPKKGLYGERENEAVAVQKSSVRLSSYFSAALAAFMSTLIRKSADLTPSFVRFISILYFSAVTSSFLSFLATPGEKKEFN